MRFFDYKVTISLKNGTALFAARVQCQPGELAAMSEALNLMRNKQNVQDAPVNELLINVEKL